MVYVFSFTAFCRTTFSAFYILFSSYVMDEDDDNMSAIKNASGFQS